MFPAIVKGLQLQYPPLECDKFLRSLRAPLPQWREGVIVFTSPKDRNSASWVWGSPGMYFFRLQANEEGKEK